MILFRMGLGGRCAIVLGALCCACSFDGEGTTTAAHSLEDDDGSATTSGSSSGNPTSSGGSTTTPVGSTGKPDPTTSPVTTAPPLTTGPTDTQPETTGGSSSSDTGAGETEAVVDCARPRTYMLGPSDAELAGPMQQGSIQGIDHVFSPQAEAGQASFRFDVECPSVYRLFARVRDDIAGVNNCCDPDSFEVQLGGDTGTWYYGCDTVTDGFSWLAVEDGSTAETCLDPEVMTFELSVGEHMVVFQNREPQFDGAVAGLAEVVLTNDPDYAP